MLCKYPNKADLCENKQGRKSDLLLERVYKKQTTTNPGWTVLRGSRPSPYPIISSQHPNASVVPLGS